MAVGEGIFFIVLVVLEKAIFIVVLVLVLIEIGLFILGTIELARIKGMITLVENHIVWHNLIGLKEGRFLVNELWRAIAKVWWVHHLVARPI